LTKASDNVAKHSAVFFSSYAIKSSFRAMSGNLKTYRLGNLVRHPNQPRQRR